MEGMLKRAADHLEEQQPERLGLGDVDTFHRCRRVIDKLRHILGDDGGNAESDRWEEAEERFPIQITLDDPAGNSFLENPSAPRVDPNRKSTRYFRTPTQDMALGLQPTAEAVEAGCIDDSNPFDNNPGNKVNGRHSVEMDDSNVNFLRQEVVKFPTTCPQCRQEAETDMCMVDIPHFKEVIIMSMMCEKCGCRSSEIKGGGAIPRFGTRITLRINGLEDFSREVLNSDTAGVMIPELELELEEGGLDGVYTTVEGLLNKLLGRLKTANPFASGDAAKDQHRDNDGGGFSAPPPSHVQYMVFLEKVKDCVDGKSFPFTLVISDPLSNSFVGPVPQDALALSLQAEKDGNTSCYDKYVDRGVDIEEYERTHDQNEVLGLNDMKTENYQSSEKGSRLDPTTLANSIDMVASRQIFAPQDLGCNEL